MHALAIPLLALLTAPLAQTAAVPAPACVAGSRATPGGLYSVNCQYYAKNITEILSSVYDIPTLNGCLSVCDSNPACQSISFYPAGNWRSYCMLFPDYDEKLNFFSDPSHQITGTGAVAKCKNGRYSVPKGKTFVASCHANFGDPDGFLGMQTAATFHACMALCSSTAGCGAVNYGQSLQQCGMWQNPGGIPDSGSTDDDMMASVA